MNNQVVQTEKKAVVVGVLKEKKIDFKVSSNGRQMASGKLVVVCDTPLGKGEVEVKVMQFADKKDGTPNSLYKALQTVAQTYKSSLEFGEENADTIKVEGQLEDGTYYSVNKGDFVEKIDIKGTFIKRVEATEVHCCKVEMEGLISKITPKDKELEVEIIGIGYEGVAVPVTGTIPEHLVGAFQSRYQVGCTTSLYIAMIKTVVVEESKQEVGFGEGFGEPITSYSNKRIVFGGGAVKYQGTVGAISEETVKQGLALRQAKLETKKEEANKKTLGSNTSMEAGFGTSANGGFTAPQGGFTAPQGGFAGFGGFPQQ